MTDKTRTPKPGFESTADLRDSELWRAVAANLRAEMTGDDRTIDPESDDAKMSNTLADMLDRAATDSDAGMFTPEYAESLDRLASLVADMFAPEWTVPA